MLLSAGQLDPSFGRGGVVTSDPTLVGGAPQATIVQSDGKIVSVGARTVGQTPADFAIGRYNADGSVDTTFGNNGVTFTDFNSGRDLAFDVVQQADGKLVVAGASAGPTGRSDFAVARYTASGALDGAFGTGGKTTIIFGSGEDVAKGVAIQADGRIVLAGDTMFPGNIDFAVARLNSNGTPDNSFSGDAKFTMDIASGREDHGNAVAIAPDGKLVVGGWRVNATGFKDFALLRLNTNGTMDSSFGSGGKVVTDFDGQDDFAGDIAVMSNGQVVAGGTSAWMVQGSAPHLQYRTAAARYLIDGQLDSSFGGTGKVAVAIDTTGDVNTQMNAIVVLADNRIAVAGDIWLAAQHGWWASYFTADGAQLFVGGSDLDFAGTGDYATDIALTPEGKLIIGGYRDLQGEAPASMSSDWGLVRVTTHLALDQAFGDYGSVVGRLGGFQGSADGVAVQADGKVLAVGRGDTFYKTGFPQSFGGGLGFSRSVAGMVRYNVDGTLDTTFGDRGLAWLPDRFVRYYELVIAPDGKIITVGAASINNGEDLLVARYNTDGRLDTTFGVQGASVIDFGGSDLGTAVALDADGHIIVAGASQGTNTSAAAIARLNSNGTLDTTFSGDGKLIDSRNITLSSVVVLPDHRIAAAGPYGFVARYTAAGTPDSSFGTGGALNIDRNLVLSGLALQPDGKLIAGGTNLGFGEAVVARLLGSGALDGSFGSEGISRFSFGGNPGDLANALALQSDGKIVVAGGAAGQEGVARLNTDGKLDPSFGVGGKSNFKLGGGLGDAARDVAIAPDGRIVTAGVSSVDSSGDELVFGLARLLADNAAPPAPLTINGTSGADTIQVSRSGSVLSVQVNTTTTLYDAARISALFVNGGDGNDTMTIETGGIAATLHGNNGADRVTGGNENDVIFGDAGDDVISAAGGNDRIDGGSGADDMSGGAGNDTVDYSSRVNGVTIGLGSVADDGEINERDNARRDIENVWGGNGSDTISSSGGDIIANSFRGNGGNDVLRGGGGNDVLDGGAGADQLFGDAGDDQLFARDNTADRLDGGAGTLDKAQKDSIDTVVNVEGFIA